MLVIHIDSRPDTSVDRLGRMWKGLNATVLYNPRSKKEVREALRAENDLIILCGHGNPRGLFNFAWNGFIIDSTMVQFLRGKTIIGCWCYASEFADRYGLKGFFTSMFISNRDEAVDYGFPEATEAEIYQWDCDFADKINELLVSETPMNQWVDVLQHSVPMTGVRGYNYEALSYFD